MKHLIDTPESFTNILKRFKEALEKHGHTSSPALQNHNASPITAWVEIVFSITIKKCLTMTADTRKTYVLTGSLSRNLLQSKVFTKHMPQLDVKKLLSRTENDSIENQFQDWAKTYMHHEAFDEMSKLINQSSSECTTATHTTQSRILTNLITPALIELVQIFIMKHTFEVSKAQVQAKPASILTSFMNSSEEGTHHNDLTSLKDELTRIVNQLSHLSLTHTPPVNNTARSNGRPAITNTQRFNTSTSNPAFYFSQTSAYGLSTRTPSTNTQCLQPMRNTTQSHHVPEPKSEFTYIKELLINHLSDASDNMLWGGNARDEKNIIASLDPNSDDGKKAIIKWLHESQVDVCSLELAKYTSKYTTQFYNDELTFRQLAQKEMVIRTQRFIEDIIKTFNIQSDVGRALSNLSQQLLIISSAVNYCEASAKKSLIDLQTLQNKLGMRLIPKDIEPIVCQYQQSFNMARANKHDHLQFISNRARNLSARTGTQNNNTSVSEHNSSHDDDSPLPPIIKTTLKGSQS